MKVAAIVQVVILCCLPFFLCGQENYFPKEISVEDYKDSLEHYKDVYGQNKSYPDKFSDHFFLALSKYPQLKNTEIDLSYKRLFTTMVARPKPSFIFKLRKNRKYTIAINKAADTKPAVSIKEVSFNAKVGILGHELSHILHYKEKSALGVMWDGIRYLFSGFKKKYEKQTDERAIKHGFGWQIYEFSDYVVNQSDAPKSYKEYKKNYYLEPEEIRKIMKQYNYPGFERNEFK